MTVLSLDVLFQGDRFRVSRKIINVQNLLEPIAFDEICVSTILLTEDHGFKVDIDEFGDVDNLNYSYPVAFHDSGFIYFSSGEGLVVACPYTCKFHKLKQAIYDKTFR